MANQIKVNLHPQDFSEAGRTLLESGVLSVGLFRFPSGVCAARLANERGAVVILPFQGQHIWSAAFDGRELTMKSMVKAPRPGVPFLETFGGFLQHCGLIGIGGPSPQDTHPLHGELPNAPYQSAYLLVGEDERGAYIGRGLDYYTKTTFEIVTSHLGAQNAILGGGRYDDMMKDFGGPDICGTGFAMGMERVLSAAAIAPTPKKALYLAYLGDEAKRAGLELARFLRGNGVECLVEYKDRGMKAHFGRANKLQAAWVLIVGENEMKADRFGPKAMASGRQVDGTREELLALLRKD